MSDKPKTEPEKESIVRCPYCESIDFFFCSNCESEIALDDIKELIKQELIEKFLKRLDWIMQRILFHTENPDSELMDEVSDEYKKWEGELI